MYSITKNNQDEKTLRAMVKHIFGADKLVSYNELTEGYFNIAYEIILEDGKEAILKIAPKPQVEVLSYEKNLMHTEVACMRLARSKGIQCVPVVYGYDDSETICPSPYFFMEKVKGNSLLSVKEMLDETVVESINVSVGEVNHSINDITCDCFGYPSIPDSQGEHWYQVFKKMLLMCIADARKKNVNLKIDIDQLMVYLERDKDIFSEVITPKLVHWDCWDGNIMVSDGKVVGIIDWERCIFGDPLMEVGFREYFDHQAFKKGYGICELTQNQLKRILWYDIYAMLIGCVESIYRQYETTEFYDWASSELLDRFEKLR